MQRPIATPLPCKELVYDSQDRACTPTLAIVPNLQDQRIAYPPDSRIAREIGPA